MTAPNTPIQDKNKETLTGQTPAEILQLTTEAERSEDVAFTKKFLDRTFLRGPNRRLKELSLIFGVAREFLLGFRALHFVGHGACRSF